MLLSNYRTAEGDDDCDRQSPDTRYETPWHAIGPTRISEIQSSSGKRYKISDVRLHLVAISF
jgi:hypothetical protein